MVEKRYSETYLICDICNEEHSFDTFVEAVEGKKDLGYESSRESGDWQDICVNCQYEY